MLFSVVYFSLKREIFGFCDLVWHFFLAVSFPFLVLLLIRLNFVSVCFGPGAYIAMI